MHRFFVLFLIVFVSVTCVFANAESLPVRLHVYAQDNSPSSQAQKLLIKDAVYKAVQSLTRDCRDEAHVYAALFLGIGEIRRAAHAAAEEIGCTAEIRVAVQSVYHPARFYENKVLKAGEYPSVTVEIGSGEGKNWWCVVYPSLCGLEDSQEESDIRFYSGIRMFFQRLFG